MKEKQYALITGEPLTKFEEAILRMLKEVSESGYDPRAMVAVFMGDGDAVMTYYHETTMTDLMLAKGFIDLDIQNDNIVGNLPWYIEAAAREGLIESLEDDDDEWDTDNEEDIEDG